MQTDFEQYGISNTEKASGISLIVKYDSRRNPINPQKGIYANILFQPKFTFMGSDANWQSLLLEFRTYIKFPAGSRNILAFWSYNWFTVAALLLIYYCPVPPGMNSAIREGDIFREGSGV